MMMNNEKLILEALKHLLVAMDVNDPKIEGTIIDIEDALNPKEVVPYEDSLIEVCADCGIKELHHDPKNLLYDRTCKKFVKSSKGEENG